MNLPKTLLATAALALAVPSSALAAAPWTDPATIPGSAPGGTPRVIDDAVAFNAPGSIPGAPLLRSVDGAAATTWDNGAHAFNSGLGAAFAAGDQIIYAGSNGARRVNIALTDSPQARWRVSLRGPSTGGARVDAAPGAAVFSTFEAGDVGNVYLVRQTGARALGPTQRLSGRGHIRSVAVATNRSGDVLVAWDRRGMIESRMWIARSHRLTAVEQLGTVTAAMHMSVALGADRRAIVAWVDQPVNEGSTGVRARVMATARSAGRGFAPARVLETYPDLTVVSGLGVKAAYTSNGRGLLAWSGRNAVRASFVRSRVIDAPRDLAPIAPTDGDTNLSLNDLAVSANGDAVVTMNMPIDDTHSQILAAPLTDGALAFGPAEPVSAPGTFLGRSSAGFDGNRAIVAWGTPGTGVELAQRPFAG